LNNNNKEKENKSKTKRDKQEKPRNLHIHYMHITTFEYQKANPVSTKDDRMKNMLKFVLEAGKRPKFQRRLVFKFNNYSH